MKQILIALALSLAFNSTASADGRGGGGTEINLAVNPEAKAIAHGGSVGDIRNTTNSHSTSNATGGTVSLHNVGNGGGAQVDNKIINDNRTNVTVGGGNQSTTVNQGSVTNNNTVRTGDQNLTNNVHQGDIKNNVTVTQGPVTATGGAGGQGGKGGEGGHAQQDQSQKQTQHQSQTATGGNVKDSGNSQQSQSVSNTGNVSNAGNSSVIITEARQVAPAQLAGPMANAPGLFTNSGTGPANANVRIALAYAEQCADTFGSIDANPIKKRGFSGDTTIIFTPHGNYPAFQEKGLKPRASIVTTPTTDGKCMCLGILQVEARPGSAGDVNLPILQSDAGKFVVNNLKGYSDIKMMFIPRVGGSLSINMGVNGSAIGAGVGAGGSGFLKDVLAFLGLSASMQDGNTFPVAQLGGVYVLLSGGNIPEGAVVLDPKQFIDKMAQAHTPQ